MRTKQEIDTAIEALKAQTLTTEFPVALCAVIEALRWCKGESDSFEAMVRASHRDCLAERN